MPPVANADIPRPEYPRPQLVRRQWLNLNGRWQFAFDDEDRGLRDGWQSGRALPLDIVVPFTFEAPLSGIDDRAAHPVVWYRREVDVPEPFLHDRLLLHIGACDYATQVWVNGRFAGGHRGGYAPIQIEIQPLTHSGANEIVVRVEDRLAWSQPRGKQIVGDKPVLIDYDRVTGIWQTVWLEPVPEVYVEDAWSHFRRQDERLVVYVEASRQFGGEVEAVVSFGGAEIARARAFFQQRRAARVEIPIATPRLWSVDDPALYDVDVSLLEGGETVDAVASYAGLREFTRRGRSLYLNDEPFYLRAVLDQGYFPGGWYTAATDADLRGDIERAKSLGFNGARKHQKAEDPRWLYWADRLGFVVWAEMASGRDFSGALVEDFTREWAEIVRRDRMHPSIMAWVPFNESWGIDVVARSARQRAWTRALYHLTGVLDGTRPVVANDGWEYLLGDIWGIHSYVASGDALAELLRRVLDEPTTEVGPNRPAALPGVDVAGVPIVLSEFGGLGLRDEADAARPEGAWAYDGARDRDEFERRIRDLAEAALAQPELSGFVWTQLTDVQQEINGLLHFDRTPKIPVEALREIFSQRARGGRVD